MEAETKSIIKEAIISGRSTVEDFMIDTRIVTLMFKCDEYPYVAVSDWHFYRNLSDLFEPIVEQKLNSDCIIVFYRSVVRSSIDALLVLTKYGLGWIFVDMRIDPVRKIL